MNKKRLLELAGVQLNEMDNKHVYVVQVGADVEGVWLNPTKAEEHKKSLEKDGGWVRVTKHPVGDFLKK